MTIAKIVRNLFVGLVVLIPILWGNAKLRLPTTNRMQVAVALLYLMPFQYVQSSMHYLDGKQPKVVFMGNSITLGWETYYPELFDGGYWVNRGIAGQTTFQMLNRFEADVLAADPEIVVLMGGTNDIAGLGRSITVDSIFINITQMVELALNRQVEVALCSVLPAHEFYCCPDVRPIPKIAALNAKLSNYAKRKKLVYIDYYSLLVDERKGIGKDWTEDGVHPNRAGYAKMLPLTIASILKAYGKYAENNK